MTEMPFSLALQPVQHWGAYSAPHVYSVPGLGPLADGEKKRWTERKREGEKGNGWLENGRKDS